MLTLLKKETCHSISIDDERFLMGTGYWALGIGILQIYSKRSLIILLATMRL